MSTAMSRSTLPLGLVLNLDAGNIASYPGTGTTWYDLSKKHHNATLVGPAFIDNSFDFNGSTDYVDVGSVTEIGASSTALTVEVWFKPDVTTSKSIIQNGSDYFRNTYYLWQHSPTELVFAVYGGSNYDAVTFTDGTDFQVGTWYHLVGVWESGKRVKLYRNADASANMSWTLGTQQSIIQNSVINGDTNTIIGKRVNDYFFNGNIPVVRLYNRALTAIQVQQNFDLDRVRFGL